MHIYIHISVYICRYIYIYISIPMSMFMSMYMSMCMCMSMCLRMCYTHLHTYMYTYTHMYAIVLSLYLYLNAFITGKYMRTYINQDPPGSKLSGALPPFALGPLLLAESGTLMSCEHLWLPQKAWTPRQRLEGVHVYIHTCIYIYICTSVYFIYKNIDMFICVYIYIRHIYIYTAFILIKSVVPLPTKPSSVDVKITLFLREPL